MTRKFLMALLIILICLSGLQAQENRTITLSRAIEIALNNNALLGAQKERLNAADWAVKQAYSGFLPKVSFDQRLTRVDDISVRNANFAIEGLKSFPGFEDMDIPPMLFKDTYETGVSVSQVLFTGGFIKQSLELSKINRTGERLTLTDNQNETALQVIRTYYTYAKYIESIKVQDESLNLAIENLNNAKSKNELGLRPRSDILRWETQISTEKSMLLELENAAEMARVTLANLLGLEIFTDFEISLLSSEEYDAQRLQYSHIVGIDARSDMKELINLAQRHNAGREAFNYRKMMAETNIRMARSKFLPQFAFNYRYAWQPNDTPNLDGFKSWSATVNMSYPIFNGFSDVADMQKARAEKRELDYRAQDYDHNLNLQIYSAYNNLKTMAAKLDIAEKNLTQADDNFSQIKSRYDLGIATNIELIDAQTIRARAHSQRLSARYDLLIAGAELDRHTGIMNKSY